MIPKIQILELLGTHGKIADVTETGVDQVRVGKVVLRSVRVEDGRDGFGLGGRFDDDQFVRFGFGLGRGLASGGKKPHCVGSADLVELGGKH